jgi:hypothetical protein
MNKNIFLVVFSIVIVSSIFIWYLYFKEPGPILHDCFIACPDGTSVECSQECTKITTTTTSIDCNTMNPNYCNINDDCTCSVNKCFYGSKDFANNCVNETNVCKMNMCFFAPGSGMVCINHVCQIGTI